MRQETAQQRFWESFGIPAFPSITGSTAPADGTNAEKPRAYIIYQQVSGYMMGTAYPSAYLWMYGDNIAELNKKIAEIAKKISTGIMIPCDGGGMRITMGEPWTAPGQLQDEPAWKMVQLNVQIQFFTNI